MKWQKRLFSLCTFWSALQEGAASAHFYTNGVMIAKTENSPFSTTLNTRYIIIICFMFCYLLLSLAIDQIFLFCLVVVVLRRLWLLRSKLIYEMMAYFCVKYGLSTDKSGFFKFHWLKFNGNGRSLTVYAIEMLFDSNKIDLLWKIDKLLIFLLFICTLIDRADSNLFDCNKHRLSVVFCSLFLSCRD